MKVGEKKWIRFRVYVVTLLFLAGMGTVLARAYQLQVLQRERLTSIALAGYKGVVKLPPKRGTIYDCEGHELAVSVEVASVYSHPHQVTDKQRTARELSRILNLNQSAVMELLNSKRPFVWIARKIAPEKARQVLSQKLEGVATTPESRRYYPGKEIAAQLIGFAGEDNEGLEGVEKKFDAVLKGPDYTLVQMRDAMRRPFYISTPVADDGMRHMVLTIDKDIQYKADQALKEVVEKTRAKGGHCIVVNPRTGEILAMSTAPLFNPNSFEKSKPALWRNQGITDCFEPGSAMKTFLMAAAIDKGIASPQTAFFCENGAYKIGTNTIHEHDAKKYGSLTLTEIVTVSSNIGAVKVGQKLGYKNFHEYLKKFGFGEKTGIDLVGEREGFVRPPRDSKEIDKATVYFGQGVTVTSLQLVMAMSAIANQGVLMKPLIVKAIKDQQGRTVKEFHPEIVRRVISREAAQKATQILENVVSEKGTAKLAMIGGYRVAGKTGTAQKVDPRTRAYSRRNYMAVFLGFVPSDDPRLAAIVVVDEPEGIPYGGVVSAPIFRQVGAWTLNHLRVNPQVQATEPVIPPEKVRAAEKIRVARMEPPSPEATAEPNAGLLPNFRGLTMRQVIQEGKTLGIRVAVEGTGLATGQVPEAGAPMERVTEVKVNFTPHL